LYWMPCPSHPPWLYHSDDIWRRVQVMKLLIMQFSEPSFTSSLFCPDILGALFSNALSLCFYLNVRDQVSHPYKTTGNTIVLYILILTFWDREKTEGSGLNNSKHYPSLTCS
jgi:hypothetical protein